MINPVQIYLRRATLLAKILKEKGIGNNTERLFATRYYIMHHLSNGSNEDTMPVAAVFTSAVTEGEDIPEDRRKAMMAAVDEIVSKWKPLGSR